MLQEPKHLVREQKVANKLITAWKCDEWGQMGPYSPFDVFLMRKKKIVALVEIRTLLRVYGEYPQVWIDLNKWFTLMQSEIGLQIPGFYVVAFVDGIWSVRIGTLPVNAFSIEYCGRADRPHSANDISPAIRVPSDRFRRIADADDVFEARNKR